MKKFFEAFVYFVENGIDPKTAKEFAEKVTGIKAPEGKIEIPKTKSPDEFQMPKAKDDVIEASDNVSGNYAAGDTKYNADILAEELAIKRGFIKEGQDGSDMNQTEYSIGSMSEASPPSLIKPLFSASPKARTSALYFVSPCA